jgi:hypothetical protein
MIILRKLHSKAYHGKPDEEAWLFHSTTCRVRLYPTVKTAGLYHLHSKSYKEFSHAPVFQKSILVPPSFLLSFSPAVLGGNSVTSVMKSDEIIESYQVSWSLMKSLAYSEVSWSLLKSREVFWSPMKSDEVWWSPVKSYIHKTSMSS